MASTNTPASSVRMTPKSQLVLSHAIATVAKTIDERMLALPGSRDRLLPAIEHAISYYEQAVAAIPGPVDISTSRHATDSALAGLFPSVGDITIGLGRSIAVRNSINWFVEQKHESVFAVLGTRQRPGGPALTDHTFRSLAASEQDARECLCEAAFTGLVNAYVTRLKERQREWRVLHAERTSDSPRPVAASTPTPSTGPSPQQQDIFTRRLDPAGDELTTEDSLAALIEWLQAPEAQLRVSAADGLKAAPPGAPDDGLALPLLSSTDRRHWLVCLGQFPVQEALGAISQTPAANRYILI